MNARLSVAAALRPILGRTVRGVLVVPVPVEYIAWTERVTGRLSPLAQEQFTKRHWKLSESLTIAAEQCQGEPQ